MTLTLETVLARLRRVENPYPGLRPFNTDEGHLFFGRERRLDELVVLLARNHFVAVLGVSGCGKSSLVKAGLIPALEYGAIPEAGKNWRIVACRPGVDPFASIAAELKVERAALAESSYSLTEYAEQLTASQSLLIVIDQFEEIFRYCQSSELRTAATDFVELLVSTASANAHIYLVITMRSDFIGDCAQFRDFPELLNRCQYTVPRMSRQERKRAIIGPLGASAMTPALVETLLNDVGDQPDHLPVLQHALARTWDRWFKTGDHESAITLEDYRAIGGLKGALSLQASEVFDGFETPRLRLIAEKMWRALTEKTDAGKIIRRPLEFRQLRHIVQSTDDELHLVIDRYRAPGVGFLISSSPDIRDSIIDISHESLMRHWPALSEWIEDEAQSCQAYRDLRASGEAHANKRKGLLRNPELKLMLDWRNGRRPTLAWSGDSQEVFDRTNRYLNRSRQAEWARRIAIGLIIACIIVALIIRAVLLEAKLNQMTQQVNAQKVENVAEWKKLDALRKTNSDLTSSIAALKKQDGDLTAETNQLQAATVKLEKSIQDLIRDNQALEDQHDKLVDEADSLEGRLVVLQRDAAFLLQQAGILQLEKNDQSQILKALETENNDLLAKATALGYVHTIFPEAPWLASTAAMSPLVANKPSAVQLPAALAHPTSLSQQIEALERQLQELLAQKVKLADEAGWLQKEDAILQQQESALQSDIANLTKLRAALIQRQHVLNGLLEKEQTENRKDQAAVAAAQQVLDAVTRKVKDQQSANNAQQQANNNLVSDVGGLQDSIKNEQKKNQDLLDFIQPRLNDLTSAALNPNYPSAWGGYLAITAYRYDPYPPDDPAHPSVYNALWTALDRMDRQVAHAAIKPDRTIQSRIANATSLQLARKICELAPTPPLLPRNFDPSLRPGVAVIVQACTWLRSR
jgi:hypothetical protein